MAFLKEGSLRMMILALPVLYSPVLMAQQVVASAGGKLENSFGSLNYTIGEGVAQTLSNGDRMLTQGFQQTYLTITTVKEYTDLGFKVSVFPNPTTDIVTLRVEKKILSGLLYVLYDLNGKLLSKKEIGNSDTTVPFQSLKPGTYMLEVLDGRMGLKTFKIIKR